MKKYLIPVFLFYHLASTAQATQNPSEFLRTGALDAQIANLGPGCRIKIDIPKGAKLAQGCQNEHYRGMAGFSIEIGSNFSHNGEWGFDFECFTTKEKQFQEIWTDITPKNDVDFIISNGKKKFIDVDNTTFFAVDSVNAQGWAITYDGTVGEERFRLRNLMYCIKTIKSAICGNSKIGYIDFTNNKKNIDIPSYAFRILESIEFLEDAPPN
ncbi:hypothetical protein [Comamonas sp. NoAH]|uniref:hypothetical protein n=1 Tax=Comamonas halotolerans TaxID=3041496 RepID=UPI0024E11E36|nr:hypothetical protein [Comamonas sp. NoAH]